jgi:hypothetical protein
MVSLIKLVNGSKDQLELCSVVDVDVFGNGWLGRIMRVTEEALWRTKVDFGTARIRTGATWSTQSGILAWMHLSLPKMLVSLTEVYY